MKKIINSILAFVTLFAVTSCDLDQDPDTAIRPEDAYSMEYCEGVRGYIYVDLKALLSGSFYMDPDIYSDLLNICVGAGNVSYDVFNWRLVASSQDVSPYWSSYYSAIMHVNYAMKHLTEAYDFLSVDDQKKVDLYMGEMHFFRAYLMHRAALLFCEDYNLVADPDGNKLPAEQQLGLPYPKEWDPEAKLPRGTLAQLYADIESDLVEAEKVVTTPGAANDPIYLTKDAITAFRAQIALHTHQYEKASQYAQSLYATYPLVRTAVGIERMWREDTSTENILQLEVLRTTMTTVNTFGSYMNASWMPNLNMFYYAPTYVPEEHVLELFEDADFRTAIYFTAGASVHIGNQQAYGTIFSKFSGNKNFQSNTTTLAYRNRPKMFRIADMYLIDAEAQYRLNPSNGLAPLNELREARGLAALTAADVAGTVTIYEGQDPAQTIDKLFKAIQDERLREFIGEGGRLYDLKRWNQGFVRNINVLLSSLVDVTSYNQTMQQKNSNPRFVWPIPQSELTQNPNFGQQNQGYY